MVLPWVPLYMAGFPGFTPATFTLSLSAASGHTITMSASTADGSALAASDYVATNMIVTFQPGQLTAQATVLVQGDNIVEPNEVFFLTLSNPVAATLAVAQGSATILNDDYGAGVLDHFEWNVIPSPETIGRPINVTITARDGVGALMPFNGTVSFTASSSGANPFALTPSSSTTFVNGVWSGTIMFPGIGTNVVNNNVVVVANDGAGHIGASNPFDVNIADLALTGTAPAQVLIATPFNYSLLISNRGPSTATAVSITNTLPPDVAYESASGGTCAFANGVVVCDVGSLTNGGTANVTLVLMPLRGGLITNLVSVAAFETDLVPANNRTTNVITITGDDDHDGMPDVWESEHGLSSFDPSDANQDPDGDGATNLQEYIAGTDPHDPSSVLKIFPVIQGNTVELRFRTVQDIRYAIERAPSPVGPWTQVGSVIVGDGDDASISDTVTLIPRFCRVRVVR